MLREGVCRFRPEAPLELGEGLVGSLQFDPGVPALPHRLDHTGCSVQFLGVTNARYALYINHDLSIRVHPTLWDLSANPKLIVGGNENIFHTQYPYHPLSLGCVPCFKHAHELTQFPLESRSLPLGKQWFQSPTEQ